MQRRHLILGLCAAAASRPASASASASASTIAIGEGAGSFVFQDSRGDASKRMEVYTYLPRGVDARTARIVFVMHGHGKDAEGYRDVWEEHADRHRCLIVTPLFDQAQWGGGEYSYASVAGRDGVVHDEAAWSFSLVEHLFDAVREAIGNASQRYFLYGHSEGGQFVHRLVLLLPDARYEKAVAANPGWYTMPRFDIRFPFGLAGAPVSDASLRTSFGRSLAVMLGERDVDPNHKQLNRTPPAMAQGSNRFERGQNFFRTAQATAASLGAPLAWQLRTVPGAAHQNSRMSRPAADWLLDA